MQPFEPQSNQSGMTLVEVMIASVIAVVFTYGGYQWLGRTTKYMAQKQTSQLGRTEAQDLASVIKKDWDYRMLNSGEPDVPPAGFAIQTAAGTDCTVGTECPRLKLWIKRATRTNEIIVENTCVKPDGTKDITVTNLANDLNFGDKTIVNEACGTCQKGYVPAVKISGIDSLTGNATVKAENRIFPNNVALNQLADTNLRQFMRINNVLGMQVCFLQAAAQGALSVDVRSIILSPGKDNNSNSFLQKIQYTQVFPFNNFANIRLEQ